MATAFVKIKRKHSLGVTKELVISGEYDTREQAENSPEAGTVYTIFEGRKILKAFKEQKNS